MKKAGILFSGVAVCLVVTSAVTILLRFPAAAEPAPSNRWEYAAITGTYAPFPAENPNVTITSAVNICYMQNNGCRNEEVTSGVAYSGFLQENRLENNQRSMYLGRNRAIDNVYAKAIAKLGAEGWEMVSRPDLQFDTFFLNSSGTYNVNEGNKDRRSDIYFKRPK